MRWRIVCRPAAPHPARQRPPRPEPHPDAPRAAQLDNPYSPVFGAPRSREQLLRRRK
ncbi:MAG: hypothetical protein ACI4JC_06555 [Faecalibacterium sp.]